MPFSELPLPVLVALFLTAFVLVGIYPALKRTVIKLRKLLRSAAQSKKPIAALLDNVHAELFAKPPTGQLNDFEIIVLRRLAQAGGKALSRKQVNAHLLFGEKTLHKTLRSLNRRGLVHVKVSLLLLRQRFALSEAGRRYAIEQGYIIPVHKSKTGVGNRGT
ncbi:MAG: hypothetical protein KAT93_06660 [Desulfuromonadales bacterium]|nr:hypothetical protein [Desulfuromonadales bacterium]